MKYIDLGLSVLWADCNMGAITPEEFGNYYKWGEIPKGYEIPTKKQQDELRENCTWVWTTQNGVDGHKVISKVNGNSIFLPAAGYCNDSDQGNIIFPNYKGYYWSSSPCTGGGHQSYYLIFNSGYVNWSNDYRFYRQPVRSIKSKTNFKNKTTMTLKEVNEIFPLKSGMCLKITQGKKVSRVILFQYGNEYMCYTEYDNLISWGRLENLMLNEYDRIEIFKSPSKINIFEECDKIFDSIDYEVKELTLQEISDKFGIKVGQLRIKG